MADATAPLVPDRNLVDFQDVYISLTAEEWFLLNEDQRILYSSVMLENFILASSVGLALCRHSTITQPGPETQPNAPHGVDIPLAQTRMIQEISGPGCQNTVNDENESSEMGVSIRVPQVRTLQVGHSTQKSHQCDTCDPILKDILHLAGQQGTAPGQQSYPCKSCGRAFWFSVNPDQIPTQQSGETSGRMEKGQAQFVNNARGHISEAAFTGRKDGEDFSAGSGLVHSADHNVEVPCQSAECKEAFHSEQSEYICSECGKLFGNHPLFILHQKSHNKKTFYQCLDCGKLFRCSSSLETHLKIHMGILKPYACAECGKSYYRNPDLVQHQKTHTGARPFECSVCQKTFTRKNTLTQHQKIHSGEKPYSCNKCDKAFSRKHVLINHQRVHTGEKIYECDECRKFFSSHTSLKIHKRLHSGVRPYVCNECGKPYVTNSRLIQHKKIHTKSRPMGEENVETSASLNTRDETLEQGLMCSAREPIEDAPTLRGS